MDALRHPSLTVRYRVPASHPDWTLSEEPMPESQPHDLVIDLLKALLVAWVARAHLDAQVARNLAVRWDEAHPNIGIDPDLCVITPRTPEGDDLTSLRTWCEGHTAPRLAIEVVSESNPRKDYRDAPDRYAASGTQELVIFDPKLAGPHAHGGPFRLQVWRRESDDDEGGGDFTRVYAGEGPVRSEVLGAWLVAVDEGRRLRIADDEGGTSWWMTAEETERAAKEAALARLAALEEELRTLKGAGR
ncbi:MAG: Uma2 family endonuclease [Byssovorax sp.]